MTIEMSLGNSKIKEGEKTTIDNDVRHISLNLDCLSTIRFKHGPMTECKNPLIK
jgi:hypothetical protein